MCNVFYRADDAGGIEFVSEKIDIERRNKRGNAVPYLFQKQRKVTSDNALGNF